MVNSLNKIKVLSENYRLFNHFKFFFQNIERFHRSAMKLKVYKGFKDSY